MSAPLLPSPLDFIGRRRFAFYPPIRHPDPNEWLLGAGFRSEVQAINAHTGHEVWIPRQYIGGVSGSHDAPLVVGLTRTLEFHAGTVAPRTKDVIQMPLAAQMQGEHGLMPRRCKSREGAPAAVVAIRLEQGEDSARYRAFHLLCIGAVVVALLAACVADTTRLW